MLLEWYGRHNLWLKNYHFRDADYSRDVRNCVNWFKVPLVETTSLSQRVVRPFTPGNHQFLFSGNTALKEFARGTFGKLKSLFIDVFTAGLIAIFIHASQHSEGRQNLRQSFYRSAILIPRKIHIEFNQTSRIWSDCWASALQKRKDK